MADRLYLRGHPDDLLLRRPPSPPVSPSSQVLTTAPRQPQHHYDLRAASDEQRTLSAVVTRLSRVVRYVHQRLIHWPDEGTLETNELQSYYHDILISPIVAFFNQLRCRIIEDEIQFRTDFVESEGLTVFTFHADDFVCWEAPVHTPVIIFSKHPLSSNVQDLSGFLHRGWEIDAESKIILSDLKTVSVFHPPSQSDSPDVIYESRPLDGDLSALRVLLTAYLYESLPSEDYIDMPFPPDRTDLLIPEGCAISPNSALLSDTTVFETCHRHSDFDLYTLSHDRERALQFYRWKKYVIENVSLRVASPGDVLRAKTNGFLKRHAELKPFFSPDPMPLDTLAHMRAVQRPTAPSDFISKFQSSGQFTIELLDDLAPQGNTVSRLCRIFTCRVRSVDEDAAYSGDGPTLCVKIFDDRFFPMDDPVELEELELEPIDWMSRIAIAEDGVRREDAAYKKLAFAQGSLVPYYYGAHTFTLPGGHEVYGILTEYLPARSVIDGSASSLSRDQQKQLTHSARHAIRVLQLADVAQHDWHPGQILYNVLPGAVHCVLIDFAFASQSLHEQDMHRWECDDWGDCLKALLDPRAMLDGEIVWEEFADRETWDTVFATYVVNGGEPRYRVTDDPFSFVYGS